MAPMWSTPASDEFFMRCPVGFICALALCVVGCSGMDGDPYPGNRGTQGQGGGGSCVHPGLYVPSWPDVVLPYRGRVYVDDVFAASSPRFNSS